MRTVEEKPCSGRKTGWEIGRKSSIYGRHERIRTADLYRVKVAL